MSLIHWLSVVTIGGCLIVGTASAQQSKQLDTENGANNAIKKITAKPAKDIKPIDAAAENQFARIARALEALAAKPNPPDDSKREQEDLKAQQDMADAASWMLVIGIVQALFTGLGILYVRKTLRENKRATDAAIKAAEAASSEFLSNHRPEIRIKHVWLASDPNGDIWEGKTVHLDVVVVNVGSTAATVKACNAAVHIIRYNSQLPAKPSFPIVRNLNERLESGISLHIPNLTDGIPLSVAQNNDLQSGGKVLYAVGTVEYIDSANRLRTTAFCRRLRQDPSLGSYLSGSRFFREDKQEQDYEYQD